MAVGSVLEVTDGKTKEIVTPMTVYGADGQQSSRPSESKLLNATVQLVSMNVGGIGGANASTVTIGVYREALVVDASVKPFIGLVWVGTIVMFFGVILATKRRLQES
jgi:cytochrome c-type biogenesis protein CcmF